jgi:hypothetical protein
MNTHKRVGNYFLIINILKARLAAYERLAVGSLSAHDVPDCGRACALHLPRKAAFFIDQKLVETPLHVEQTTFEF